MKNLKLILAVIVLVGIDTTTVAQEKIDSLQHVLLFDWKENAEESQKNEVLNLFQGLVDKVEGLNSLTVKTLKKSSENFDIVLILEFSSEEALQAYEVHPDHIKISTLAPPLLVGYSVFDFYGSFCPSQL